MSATAMRVASSLRTRLARIFRARRCAVWRFIVPLSKTTTDHEQIRSWVEERGGWPAAVKATERRGDPGILRIDFPGFSGEGRLERIDWDEFFRKFDESGLAF